MKESSVFKPDSSVLDSDTRYPLDLCVLESEGKGGMLDRHREGQVSGS